jgi:pimeloyl-ACP methyl ester carboxylesterase
MNPGFPGSAVAPWFESKKRLSEDSRTTMTRVFEDWNSGYEWLEMLRIPVLLIVGSRRKGPLFPSMRQDPMPRNNPNIQIVHFPKANHNIRRCDFSGYLNAVRGFLNGLDSFEFSDASFRRRERR